jgi:hypothetical protein
MLVPIGSKRETQVAGDDAGGVFQELKARPGGDILVEGSGHLVHTLIEHGWSTNSG